MTDYLDRTTYGMIKPHLILDRTPTTTEPDTSKHDLAVDKTTGTVYTCTLDNEVGQAWLGTDVTLRRNDIILGDHHDVIAKWTMDSISGSILQSEKTPLNDATLVGSPPQITGKFGNALGINGTSQYIHLPSATNILGDEWTVAAWMAVGAGVTGERKYAFGQGKTGSGAGYSVDGYFDRNEAYLKVVFDDNTSVSTLAPFGTSLGDGTWALGIFEYKRGSHYGVWINNVQVLNNSLVASDKALRASDYGVRLSGDSSTDAAIVYEEAVQDSITIYERLLTAEEKTKLWEASYE